MSKIRDEVRRRIPRLTMSLVITVIFLIISFVIQQTQHLLPFSQIDVPGIGQNISSIIIIITVPFPLKCQKSLFYFPLKIG